MNRRSFFKALGIGAAGVATGAAGVAMAREAPLPEWNDRYVPITGPQGVHTHMVCNCHSPHNHGCPEHTTGVYSGGTSPHGGYDFRT